MKNLIHVTGLAVPLGKVEREASLACVEIMARRTDRAASVVFAVNKFRWRCFRLASGSTCDVRSLKPSA